MEKLLKDYAGYFERFLSHSEAFIARTCRRTGSKERIERGEVDYHYINDYRYFTFTKNTRLLRSCYTLLKEGCYEEVICLCRTMFECYLSARYVDECFDPDLIRDMIVVPLEIARRTVIPNDNSDQIYHRETNELLDFQQRSPNTMHLGKDKRYFFDLYALLCSYVHCNFSQVLSYLDEDQEQFVLYTDNNAELAHILPLFLFYKNFESTVLLEQVLFPSEQEEAECCALIEEVTVFLYERFSQLSASWEGCYGPYADKHTRKLFSYMKVSLKEQLGRVDKSFVQELEKKKYGRKQTAAQ